MSVTIVNNTRRMKVFNLTHASYCDALGRCACTILPGRAKRRVATSLTIPAGGEFKGLADAVLAVPEIARAVKAGQLTAKRSRPRRAEQPSKPKPSQATAKGSKRGKK